VRIDLVQRARPQVDPVTNIRVVARDFNRIVGFDASHVEVVRPRIPMDIGTGSERGRSPYRPIRHHMAFRLDSTSPGSEGSITGGSHHTHDAGRLTD
jgi:hypothetical protein